MRYFKKKPVRSEVDLPSLSFFSFKRKVAPNQASIGPGKRGFTHSFEEQRSASPANDTDLSSSSGSVQSENHLLMGRF